MFTTRLPQIRVPSIQSQFWKVCWLIDDFFCRSGISDCDETYNYWEPAYQLLYGHGLQTWEYDPKFALRSYLYIMMHLVPAWVYAIIAQPNPMLVFYISRFMFGLVCALCEVRSDVCAKNRQQFYMANFSGVFLPWCTVWVWCKCWETVFMHHGV